MALTDAKAKIIAANKKKKEEEAAALKLAADMLVQAATKKSSFPTVTPSKVVTNQVTTPLKDREPTDQYTPKRYTTTRKTTSLLSDMGSRDQSILDRMRSDSGRLYTPLDVIRDRISIGDTAQTLAYRARQQDNGDWQENLRRAAEERVARRQKLDSYVLSDADSKLPSTRREMVQEAKDAWQRAKDEGDIEGMRRAHEKAENVRGWAGYSGGPAGDEYITADLTWDEKRTLNQTGQNKLKKAKLDRQKAWEEKDAKGVQDATRAMAEIMSAVGYRANPSDVERPTDAYGRPMMTAEERLEDAARAMAGVKSVGTGVVGSLLSLAETGNQAMRNYTRERWGRNLEANANQYEDPLLAQKARARLGESTIVDQNLPGQSLMRKSQEYAAEALDGTSGVEKFLGEAALSIGQNLPGIALSMIPGAQGAGLALLGAQAAGARAWELNEQSSQAFLDSLILGGEPEDYGSVEPGEALMRGLASGGVELLTEKIPLDNLAKILRGKSGQNGLKSILKQMGIEGAEEGTAYTANFLLDKIAQDPNAEWTVEEFLKNAAMGAVSGGAMAGGGTAIRGAVDAGNYTASYSDRPDERTVRSVLENQETQRPELATELESGVSYKQVASDTKASDTKVGDSEARTEVRTEVRNEARTAQKAAEAPETAPARRGAPVAAEARIAQPAKASEAVEPPAVQRGKQADVRRIEGIPVEVETIQTKRVAAPVSANYLSEMSSTLGKSGSKAMQVAWDGKSNQAQYTADFIRVYNQTLTGTSIGRIQAPDSLSDAQVQAAYDAGKNDRQFSLEEAKTAAQFAPVAGKDSGLVYDDYVKAEMDTTVASEINTVAKQLGLRVQMVDSVKGGEANADIQGSVVRIEKGNPNPVRFLFGHEMTHRVQTLAPESYRKFRDFVMSSPKAQDEVQRKLAAYKSRGVDLTSEEAMDEIAADYAGQLIESTDLMKRFIDQNRKNQSMLSRFLTALKDLATKLTGRRKAQVNDAVALLEKAVGEASKHAKSLAKNKNTAQTDGVDRYSVKDEVLALDGVDWMDNFSSIKDQLRKHADEVNAMEPVAVVDYAPKSAPRLVSTMMGEVAKLGGKSMKNNGVRFSFDEAGAKSINAHAKSHELRAAALASPYVAKHGKLIAGQKNHENTGLTTLTYAAPVVINDTTVNVGLAIQFQENGRPRAVNVGLQSGGVFKVDTKKAPKGLDSRVSRYGRGTSLPTMSASESTVARGGEDVKTRFSLKTPVEQTRNLVALHNLSEDKLMKSLDLGGFPMPSIAVTAADIPHTNFGDITLIMNKSTVDPKAGKKNVVYSADAWTPTFPRIEYEVNRDAEFALYDKVRKVGDKLPDMYANRVNVMAASIEDYLNNEGSEEGVIARFKNEYAIKALYLADKGETVEIKTQEVRHEKKTSEMLDAMLELFEEDVETLRKMPLNQLHAKYAESMKQVLLDHGRTEQQAEMAVAKKGGPIGGFDKYISRIIRYAQEPTYRTETVTDTQAMEKDIDRKVDAKGLDKWLNDMFRGLVKDTGVRNEKDIFTPSGKRRSFQQTHYPVTLDNIAKAMSRQNGGNTVNAVGGFYGIKTLRAGTAKRFKSIADMHKSEGRLKNLTEDEAKKVNDALDERLNDIISRVYENMPHKGSNQFIYYDTIGQIIMEVATGKTYTVDSIHKTFSQYGYKLGNQLCADIRDLLFDVSQMPVNIFEAKPERAVRFDEVLAAVVPDTASTKLRERLDEAGVNVLEYKQDDDADRLAKVNSVEGARFSLKAKDKDYLAAVERGDMDTAQKMVAGFARENGYTPVKRYHQTAGGFTKFSTDNPRAGLNDSETPNGIFFKENDHDIGLEGKVQLQAYLKADNMLHFRNREEANKWYCDNVEGYATLQDECNAALKPFLDELDKIENQMFDPSTTDEEYDVLDEKWSSVLEETKEVENLYRGQLRELLNEHFLNGESGYDGIELDYDGHRWVNGKREDVHTFIVFDPAQAKSADPVTYDDSGNVIPLSERFSEGNPDIRHSLKGISGYENLVEKFGAIEPGEDPRARDIQVPKQTEDGKKVSRTVRTILEAGSTTDEMVPTIKKMVEDGEFSYEAAGDKAAIETAEATIRDKGFQAALMDWTSSLAKGEVNKQNVATGWALYDAAAQAGDAKTAADIMTRIVIHQRNAAQAVQATRILKRMSPSAQLYGIQRSVQNMQEELNTKYGDKAPNLKVPDELIERYLNAESQEERDEAEIEIYKSIGKQMPSTFQDKWNAWRYLAMLFNVRTHIRNVSGNAFFALPVMVKNFVGVGLEGIGSVASGGKMQKTKGVYGPDLFSAAWKDYKKSEAQIMAGGKYDDSVAKRDIMRDSQVVFDWKILAPVEWLRRFNSGALQAEDGWFCKPHYANALAQYCAANGITAEQVRTGEGVSKKALDKARAYAIKEAQKATYRDFNEFSDFIGSVGRYSGDNKVKKAFSAIVEGVLPFRKTPANILVRAVEYSPIGLASGIWELTYGVKSGKNTAAEALDRLASGMTGSGLFALGFYLASQGLIVASGDDDEKQKAFDDLLGRQDYSIEMPDGTNFTVDWLAPECIPVFMGAEFFRAKADKEAGGEFGLTEFLSSMTRVTNPMLEMSCLSSLNDLLDNLSEFKAEEISSLVVVAANMAISYLTQGVPTLLGQAERASQEDRMTTYTDKNLDIPTDWQYTIGKVSAKIPKWDYNQIPYIDAWGRTESETSKGKRILNNFINPAYTSKYYVGQTEAELQRLYDAVGEDFEGTILPSRADRYFNVDGERVDLSAEQYVTYAKEKGQRSYALMQKITTSSWYSGADDAVKAEVIKNAYQVANEDAKKALFPDYVSKNNVYLKAAAARDQENMAVGDYLYLYAITGDVESLKYKSGSDAGETISNSKSYQIAEKIYDSPIVLTDSQRAFVYEAFGVGKTVSKANYAKVKQELATMRKQAGV